MMTRWGAAGVAAFLLGASALAGEPADTTIANPVADDWLRKADVLYVGDSESLGYFGDNLYQWLSEKRDPQNGRPLRVWTFWTCGSDVTSWLVGARTVCGIRTCNGAGRCGRDHGPNDGPGSVSYGPLRKYLSAVTPRLTVISLGTNFLTTRDFTKSSFYGFYLTRIQTMTAQVRQSGSRCIWIGPPQPAEKTRPAAEYDAFVADMRHAVEGQGCSFVDSSVLSDRRYVLPRDPEGTHYSGQGEKLWAAAAWKVMAPLVDKALAGRP